jgi:tRNA threonylcarbamoyladenosine biosynthesis protein TsaE
MFGPTVMNIDQLPDLAAALLKNFPQQRVFLLNGEMGSGKTTFIKELCKALGVTSHMSSPTYSIVNEYASAKGLVYHFDLYRLKNINECMDIGFEEYVHSGNYCFIEWPEIALPLLPEQYLEITIKVENEIRQMSISLHGV